MEQEILDSPDSVAERACQLILSAAANAIARRGLFRLVLAGGTTPAACYRRLADAAATWQHWHLFFGDERCLDPDDPDRNSTMVATALTGRVAIPGRQIHPIPAERGAEIAARDYEQTLAGALPFDLVLLGLGEDGHTASLFPGHVHPPGRLVVPVHDAPKPPPDRVSLSAAALGECRELIFLVTGAGKQAAVRQWQSGQACIASGIQTSGTSRLLMDSAAAGSQATPAD